MRPDLGKPSEPEVPAGVLARERITTVFGGRLTSAAPCRFFNVVRANGIPRVVPTGEKGHGALADILDAIGVEVLICGGIGGGGHCH